MQRLNCIKFGFGSHALRFDFSESDSMEIYNGIHECLYQVAI